MEETLTIYNNSNQSQFDISSSQLPALLQAGELQNDDFVLVGADWVGIAEYLATTQEPAPNALALPTEAASSAASFSPASTRKEYHVTTVTTGLFSGSLKPEKLRDALNAPARQGWTFLRSIHETKTVLFIFKREAHFLIFSRDA